MHFLEHSLDVSVRAVDPAAIKLDSGAPRSQHTHRAAARGWRTPWEPELLPLCPGRGGHLRRARCLLGAGLGLEWALPTLGSACQWVA